MGGLLRPRPPSLHSSPLGSCCALPNLLAGDKNTLAAPPPPAPSKSCSARAGDTIEPSCPSIFTPTPSRGVGVLLRGWGLPLPRERRSYLSLSPGHRSSALQENGAAHRGPSQRRHHHVQSLAHDVPHPPANSNRHQRARAGSCSWGWGPAPPRRWAVRSGGGRGVARLSGACGGRAGAFSRLWWLALWRRGGEEKGREVGHGVSRRGTYRFCGAAVASW